MSIRLKIILVVLPVLAASVLIVGLTSARSARAGITRVAVEALGFKAQELRKYADNQWDLLLANDLADDPTYVAVTRRAVQSYAASLVRRESELIFALDRSGNIVMSSAPVAVTPEEQSRLTGLAADSVEGWQRVGIAGEARVGQAFAFAPFDWLLFVTDTEASFYREVAEIDQRTYIILAASAALALLLLVVFSGVLTSPLERTMSTMLEISRTKDPSKRVEVEFRDEIGAMATTFNRMLAELEGAEGRVRSFAREAVVRRRTEQKLRTIFQAYVPNAVIESVITQPEAALVGAEKMITILFTDIRSFTTITADLLSDEVVRRLNTYFEPLVEIVMNHHGTVNKYIGDAIMGFFGSPEERENEALDALQAALDMQRSIGAYNTRAEAEGKKPFRTGIGLDRNYVTVGNIGSDRKLEYTIIGRAVNRASRLEGLTKYYKQELIFSDTVFRKVKSSVPCRELDVVLVQGEKESVTIYTAASELSAAQEKTWGWHHAGVRHYRNRDFAEAARYFRAILDRDPDDAIATMYLERCARFSKKPPTVDWKGVWVMESK